MQSELAKEIKIDPRFDPLTRDAEASLEDRWAKDDKLFVRFYKRPVINPHASTQAGRSIFDEQDYIVIHTPGSQLSVIDSPVVGTKYERRFAKRYKAWKDNQNVVMSGTPLEAFPFLVGKVGLQAELKYLNVHTVEQLAGISDSGLHNFMGGYDLRKKAQEWLTQTTGTDAQLVTLSEENAKLKARLDALEAAGNHATKHVPPKHEPTPAFLKPDPAKKA